MISPRSLSLHFAGRSEISEIYEEVYTDVHRRWVESKRRTSHGRGPFIDHFSTPQPIHQEVDEVAAALRFPSPLVGIPITHSTIARSGSDGSISLRTSPLAMARFTSVEIAFVISSAEEAYSVEVRPAAAPSDGAMMRLVAM